jgi:putative transposase
VKYTFIHSQRRYYSTKLLCEVMSVSRRGYYNWLSCPESTMEQNNQALTKAIQRIFSENRQVYGAPRIHRVLIEEGYHCSLNRVARLMRKAKIVPKTIRKFRVTTDSRKSIKPTSSLLNRQFSPAQMNRVWASDVTYIPTREDWLFLAVVLDLYSRKVMGWSMSERLTSCLAQQALINALNQRCISDGVLHHSDQGKEYYAHEFQALLKSNKMIGSMGREGECYDNAVVESFFHSLKIELIHQCDYNNREEARISLFDYIELFYNRKRKHSYLGYLSPVAFEKKNLC